MENSPSSYKRDMKAGGKEADVCLSDCISILKILNDGHGWKHSNDDVINLVIILYNQLLFHNN